MAWGDDRLCGGVLSNPIHANRWSKHGEDSILRYTHTWTHAHTHIHTQAHTKQTKTNNYRTHDAKKRKKMSALF